MIVAAFKSTRVRRDADGSVTMFYSSHCMDPAGRRQSEAADRLVTSPGSKQAKVLVTELIRKWNELVAASAQPGWGERSAVELNNAIEWLASVFRARVAPIKPRDQSIIAGLFPSCSPDHIKSDDYSSAVTPSGWEGMKCTLTRAAIAAVNPIGFVKANKCEILTHVTNLAAEAIGLAIMMVILSNPISGLAVGVGARVGIRQVAKYLMRWVWFGGKQLFTKKALKKYGILVVVDNLSGWLEAKLGDFAATVSALLMRYGFNIGQADASFLNDENQLACVKEYMVLMMKMILHAVMFFAFGDKTGIFLDLVRCWVMKGFGCDTDKYCVALSEVSDRCVPGGDGKPKPSRRRAAAQKAIDDLMAEVYHKMAEQYMDGYEAPDTPADTPDEPAVQTGVAASTCYTKCQTERLDVAVPGAVSGTALRCPNNNADHDVVSDYGIQVYLKCNGLYRTGPLSGTWNPQMESAILAFQECAGVQADGLVGPATRDKMKATTAQKIQACGG
jgi:hypothetical protein